MYRICDIRILRSFIALASTDLPGNRERALLLREMTSWWVTGRAALDLWAI